MCRPTSDRQARSCVRSVPDLHRAHNHPSCLPQYTLFWCQCVVAIPYCLHILWFSTFNLHFRVWRLISESFQHHWCVCCLCSWWPYDLYCNRYPQTSCSQHPETILFCRPRHITFMCTSWCLLCTLGWNMYHRLVGQQKRSKWGRDRKSVV